MLKSGIKQWIIVLVMVPIDRYYRTKVIMNNRVDIISGHSRGGKRRDSERVCFSDSLYINTI